MKIKNQIIIVVGSISIILALNIFFTKTTFKLLEETTDKINTVSLLLKYLEDFNYVTIDFESKREAYTLDNYDIEIQALRQLKKQQLYIMNKLIEIIQTNNLITDSIRISLNAVDSIRNTHENVLKSDSLFIPYLKSQAYFESQSTSEFENIESHIYKLQTELNKKSKNDALKLFYFDILETILIIIFTLLIIRILVYDNRKLKMLIAELRITNQTKDKFFSIISHDLKNPFNVILGMSELLIQNIEKYPKEKIKEFVEHIYNTSKKTYELLENLLEWSKLQRGKIQPVFKHFTLVQVTDNVVQLVKSMAEQKYIQLSTEINSDITIVADIEMIKTVLRNLITNSIKFTEINGQIVVKAHTESNNLIISIEDNGIGMEKTVVDSLFRIDSKISTRGTQGEKGTGLGLLLCKELVELNNGKIEVESKVDEGTKFRLVFPVNEVSKQKVQK